MAWTIAFPFLVLLLKHVKELESFCGIKAQFFGGRKDIVSISYLSVLEFLAHSSLRIHIMRYCFIDLENLPNVVRDKP